MKNELYEFREYGVANKRVIYLIGGWGISQSAMFPVSKLLEFAGFYCITITLSRAILSPDMEKTVQSILHVKRRILRSIKGLIKAGHQEISLFGTSLGALVGLLVVDASPQINKVIFNIPGMDLAESIWGWDGVLSEFRSKVAQEYHTCEALKNTVLPISIVNCFSRLQGKDLLFYLSAKDKVALSDSSVLRSTLESYNYQFEIVVNAYFGHAITGFINLFNASHYLKFLFQKKQKLGVV